jgi:transcriptional regulator with PAS, ATPase and Fis domain
MPPVLLASDKNVSTQLARRPFSGAGGSKRRLFELANGGIALSEKIGEIRFELGVKMLRVLVERELCPLGSLSKNPSASRIRSAIP